MANRDLGGRLALDNGGLCMGALLHTYTIIKDVVNVARVGSSRDIADIKV